MRQRLLLSVALAVACSACRAFSLAAAPPQDSAVSQQAIDKSHHLEPGLFDLPGNDPAVALLESLLKKQAHSLLLHKDQLKGPENQQKLEQEWKKLSQIVETLGKKDPSLAPLIEKMKGSNFSRPESVEEWMKQLPKALQPSAPATPDLRHPKSDSPDLMNRLQGLLGKGSHGGPSGADGGQTSGPDAGMARGPNRPGPPAWVPPRQPMEGGTSRPEKTASTANPTSPWAERLVREASRFQSLNPTLSRSEALGRAIQNLSHSIGERDPRWQQLADRTARLRETLDRWRTGFDAEKLGFIKDLSWPKGLPRPSLPAVHLPESGLPPAPVGAAPTQPRAGKWPVFLGLLGLAAVAVLFWRLRSTARQVSRETEWRLGPWPVNPAAVTTREEVVCAFEYLSLLRLGRAARTWNHRTIAGQLARRGPVHRTAAGQTAAPVVADRRAAELDPGVLALAGVYE
jgi:hypothetical protein